MIKKTAKHLLHYLPLIGVLLAGSFAFWFFSYNRAFQIVIAVVMAVSYVLWGVIHHMLHKDLHLSTVVEYVVIASLGLIIIFSVIFRA